MTSIALHDHMKSGSSYRPRYSVLIVFALSCFAGCFIESHVDLPPSQNGPTLEDTLRWGNPVRMIWKTPIIAPAHWGAVNCHPFISEQLVVFPHDHALTAVAKETGKIVWEDSAYDVGFRKSTATYSSFEMSFAADRLYLIGEGFVHCVRLSDGHPLWHHDLTGKFFDVAWSSAGVSEKFIFIADAEAHELLALDKITGEIAWKSPIEGGVQGRDGLASWPGPPTYFKGRVYLSTRFWPGNDGMNHGGGLCAYDAETGKLIWSRELPRPDTTVRYYYAPSLLRENDATRKVIADDSGLVFGAGYTIVRTTLDGDIVWRVAPNMNGYINTWHESPFAHDGRYYAVNNMTMNSECFCVCIEQVTGDLIWKKPIGLSTTVQDFNFQLDGGLLYGMTDDGFLIGIDSHTGNLIRKILLTSVSLESKSKLVGGCGVEGNRFYFINADGLICAEWK